MTEAEFEVEIDVGCSNPLQTVLVLVQVPRVEGREQELEWFEQAIQGQGL